MGGQSGEEKASLRRYAAGTPECSLLGGISGAAFTPPCYFGRMSRILLLILTFSPHFLGGGVGVHGELFKRRQLDERQKQQPRV
jgi:hypothetical protein